MKVKAVIFDFNGTLFFDTAFHDIAWAKTVKEITGSKINDEIRIRLHGSNNAQTIHNLKPELSELENEYYSLQKEALYRAICLENPDKLHLVDGAIELFQYLKENKIPFTIASASIKENIDFFFDIFSLGDYFDINHVFYDDGSYPTKIEMYQATLKDMNVDAKDCIIFEDSKTGITCAKSIGAGYIVGISKEALPETLIEYGANECIDHFLQFNYEILK
ncbi:HAD family hydrolase [Tannockella kyphosi]|uniref:HAD family hydrolase n=1 Tax=Tannockella kyphosi TaxID=2899121 RepID=UPI0020119F1E|nr:HAD family phosphatase [Tannockella kyphosi]